MKKLLVILVLLLISTGSVCAQGRYIDKGQSAIGFSFGYSHNKVVNSASLGLSTSNGVFDFGAQVSRASNSTGDIIMNGMTLVGFAGEAYLIKPEGEKSFITLSTGAAYVFAMTNGGGSSFGVSSTIDKKFRVSNKTAFHLAFTGGIVSAKDSESSGFYGLSFELHSTNNDTNHSVVTLFVLKDKYFWTGGFSVGLIKLTKK